MQAGSNDWAGQAGRDLTLVAKKCLMGGGAKELRRFNLQETRRPYVFREPGLTGEASSDAARRAPDY